MITATTVKWEIQHSNADWDCFATLSLQEILKTQNQYQAEFCPVLEVEHLDQQVGCARIKNLSHTVLRKQKSYRWMLVMDGLLAFFSGFGN